MPEDFYHSEATNKIRPCVTLSTKIGLFVSTSSVQPVDSREATNVTTNYKQAGPPAKTALLTLASQRISNIISLPCFCTSFICLNGSRSVTQDFLFLLSSEFCHENHCYHCHFQICIRQIVLSEDTATHEWVLCAKQ